MESSTILLELLAGRLVPDQSFADAYENTTADVRGGMKTAIARACALFPGRGMRANSRRRVWEHGFVSEEAQRPAAWALICLDEDFASAPRLLAAVMPALLSGTAAVAVIRTSSSPCIAAWPPSLLCALELAGQEIAACAEPKELRAWINSLSRAGRGRCLFLGRQFGNAPAAAERNNIPVWRDSAKPVIGIPDLDAELCSFARQAHPDALLADCGKPGGRGRMNAILCNLEQAPAYSGLAPLAVSPEHAWCWHYPGLSPSWFLDASLALWRAAKAEAGA
jgi:hypothetical protein